MVLFSDGTPVFLGVSFSSFLFLIANIVTTSKALVTRSDALVPSSEPC